MKIKILKSAGVLINGEVMVVQIGKIMDVAKSVGTHLVKNNVAIVYECQLEHVPDPEPESPTEEQSEDTEVE